MCIGPHSSDKKYTLEMEIIVILAPKQLFNAPRDISNIFSVEKKPMI